MLLPADREALEPLLDAVLGRLLRGLMHELSAPIGQLQMALPGDEVFSEEERSEFSQAAIARLLELLHDWRAIVRRDPPPKPVTWESAAHLAWRVIAQRFQTWAIPRGPFYEQLQAESPPAQTGTDQQSATGQPSDWVRIFLAAFFLAQAVVENTARIAAPPDKRAAGPYHLTLSNPPSECPGIVIALEEGPSFAVGGSPPPTPLPLDSLVRAVHGLLRDALPRAGGDFVLDPDDPRTIRLQLPTP